jgi:hypothetical protein
MEHLVFGQFVDQANKLACLEILCVVSFLEIIKFFQDGDGNTNIVFCEVEDAVVLEEDDGRVENEDLLFLPGFCHRLKSIRCEPDKIKPRRYLTPERFFHQV